MQLLGASGQPEFTALIDNIAEIVTAPFMDIYILEECFKIL